MQKKRSERMRIGSFVKARRRRLEFSLRELSERSGLGYTYLSKIENDHVNPSPSAILKLADALDVPYDRLLTYTGLPLRRELRGSGSRLLGLEQEELLSEVRVQAILALGRLGFKASVGLLLEMLTDQDLRVRASAAKALGDLDAVEAGDDLMHLVVNPGRKAHRVLPDGLEETSESTEVVQSSAGAPQMPGKPGDSSEWKQDPAGGPLKRRSLPHERQDDDVE